MYLMLPMFQGSEKVFRYVLVPLAGLRNMLLKGDALKVKMEMFQTLSPEQIDVLRHEIARSFAEDDSDLPRYLQQRINSNNNNNNSNNNNNIDGGKYGSIQENEN